MIPMTKVSNLTISFLPSNLYHSKMRHMEDQPPLPPENKAGTLVVYNHGHSKFNVGGDDKLSPGSESIRKVQAHYSTRMTDHGVYPSMHRDIRR